ncbi:MAG: GatB/YqeY domain-containing protein [Candidatus Yanofskybacteria bacterium]|nr:GatB/YqeY domain-containing protein [Candidatus Yanofskybacteria bacterium]
MIKERLQKELNDSLKLGNHLKRSVLGMVITAIKNREVEKRTRLSRTVTNVEELEKLGQLSDEETIEVISGEVKKRKESVEQFTAGGRNELAQKERLEIDILMSYLPEQMPENAIRAEIQKIIAELGASGPKDMGRVIGSVMAKLKGQADGGTVSKITKELLAQ